ncbi:MFS transporter, partial [Thioclava sp. BHET1]
GLVLAFGGALVFALSFACREPGGALGTLGGRARPALALGVLPLIGGAVIFLGFVTENAAELWSALHIERTLHAPPGTGSIGPALLALTMGIGRMSGQVVAARLSEDRLLRLAVGLTALGAIGTALAVNLWMAYLGLMVMGLGVSVVVPTAFALIGRLLPADLRARGIARASVFGYLGFFIGPPVLGALCEALGLRPAFGAVAVLVVLILPLLPLLRRA